MGTAPGRVGSWENQPNWQDKQRLGNLPSTSHTISHLKNVDGEIISDMVEAEQEGSDRAQPTHLIPVL